MGRVRVFAASVTLALVVSVAFAAGAGAHVTVQPGTQKQGASDVLVTFAVPNEETTASTTKVEVVFPTATPLLGVHAQAMAGWTVTVETAKLPKPVTTDDVVASFVRIFTVSSPDSSMAIAVSSPISWPASANIVGRPDSSVSCGSSMRSSVCGRMRASWPCSRTLACRITPSSRVNTPCNPLG